MLRVECFYHSQSWPVEFILAFPIQPFARKSWMTDASAVLGAYLVELNTIAIGTFD
jgi:hypothetical protein